MRGSRFGACAHQGAGSEESRVFDTTAARGAIDASRWSPPPAAQNGGAASHASRRAPLRRLPPAPARSPRNAPRSSIGNPHCPPFPPCPCNGSDAAPERQPCAPAADDSPRPRPRARNPGRPESPSSGFSRIGAAPRRGDHAKRRPLRRRENLAEDAPALAARAQVSLHGPRAAGSAPARSRRRPPTNGKNGWRSGRRNDAVCGGGAAARIDARQARGRRARIAGVQSVRRSRRRCRCRCRRSALRRP